MKNSPCNQIGLRNGIFFEPQVDRTYWFPDERCISISIRHHNLTFTFCNWFTWLQWNQPVAVYFTSVVNGSSKNKFNQDEMYCKIISWPWNEQGVSKTGECNGKSIRQIWYLRSSKFEVPASRCFTPMTAWTNHLIIYSKQSARRQLSPYGGMLQLSCHIFRVNEGLPYLLEPPALHLALPRWAPRFLSCAPFPVIWLTK